MSDPTMIVFRGAKSQTGLAAIEEFPGIPFQEGREEFVDIADKIEQEDILAILPMWNSHVGEIPRTRILKMLFEDKARLYRVWPKKIFFECISKSKKLTSSNPQITSVHVAEVQCSKFLNDKNAVFIPEKATTDAYESFRKSSDIEAALCAPGQNKHGFNLLNENASNPINFTTFVLIGCSNSAEWTAGEWGKLHKSLNPKVGMYFGVQMPYHSFLASDDQQALLDDLTKDIKSLDEIPKVLFAIKISESKCGLVIEAEYGSQSPDILVEEGFSDEIEVNIDFGDTDRRYPKRLDEFLNEIFSPFPNEDFMRHIGAQTCFFACPTFGIMIHGYQAETVEPVVKQIIIKCFELIASGIDCTEAQRAFFKKYEAVYYDQGLDFIEFTDIGLVSDRVTKD